MPDIDSVPGDILIRPSTQGGVFRGSGSDGNTGGGSANLNGGDDTVGGNGGGWVTLLAGSDNLGDGGAGCISIVAGNGTQGGGPGTVMIQAGADDGGVGGNITLQPGPSGSSHQGYLIINGNEQFPGLPSSDPMVAGALYAVAGVVKISAGP